MTPFCVSCGLFKEKGMSIRQTSRLIDESFNIVKKCKNREGHREPSPVFSDCDFNKNDEGAGL